MKNKLEEVIEARRIKRNKKLKDRYVMLREAGYKSEESQILSHASERDFRAALEEKYGKSSS